MSTATITEDTGPVTRPDDIQVLRTIAWFRDGEAVAARIGAKPLRQVDADRGLASSSGEH